MQSFFVNVYEKIRSMLCERRNSAPVINPFAVMQRTDLVVRKQSPEEIKQNTCNFMEEVKQINLPQKHPRQQQPAYPTISSSLHPRPSQHLPSLYKVQLTQLQDETQSQQQTLEYEVISESFKTMRIVSQINEKYQNLIGLIEKDQTRKKQFWKNIYLPGSGEKVSEEILQYRDEVEQSKQDQELDQNVIKKMYERDITDVRQFKYSYELIDYPQIDLQTYKNIRQLWSIGRKNPNYLIKNMSLKMLEKLIARSFKTLSFGSWLNDEIINGYLQMIELRVSQEGSKYKILNSFFAQTTFAKSQEIVQRTLKRRNITRDNILVIAINNGNHWFFARIINSMIEVFDSIPKDSLYYTSSEATCEIFSNIIKFADWFYQTKHEITVVERYPRQQNSYDCGMFLLCGIKDIVRNYQQWNFNQGDIAYKRILVGKQILDGYVQGF